MHPQNNNSCDIQNVMISYNLEVKTQFLYVEKKNTTLIFKEILFIFFFNILLLLSKFLSDSRLKKL